MNGKTFSAYGSDSMRWIEQPESVGLRFVGYADEIIERMRHTGWFTDNYQDETARGAVYQLPARDGKPRYVYGYNDMYNEGAACLSFDITADKEDAARWADNITERMAIESREDCAKFQAEQRLEEIADELTESRQGTLALISEIKAKRKVFGLDVGSIHICAALRVQVSQTLVSIAQLREERDKLKADYWEAVPHY